MKISEQKVVTTLITLGAIGFVAWLTTPWVLLGVIPFVAMVIWAERA